MSTAMSRSVHASSPCCNPAKTNRSRTNLRLLYTPPYPYLIRRVVIQPLRVHVVIEIAQAGQLLVIVSSKVKDPFTRGVSCIQ